MKRLFTCLLVIGCLVCIVSTALAVPVPLGPSVTFSGDGVNSRWVNTNYSPHNVDQALAALALGPGDPGYVGEVNQVLSAIDIADNNYEGYVPGYQNYLLSPDDNFAVGYSGYINIATADTYTFKAYTDDGFRLTIGGEMISEHYNDRSPGATDASIYLDTGFYTFSFLGWEQGGVFVNELSWHDTSTLDLSLITDEVLFTYNPLSVPEPSVCVLFLLCMAGMVGIKKKSN